MLFDIDFGNVTLVGLAILGAVNAATFWFPNMTSRAKFLLSVLVALLIGLIPPMIQEEILAQLVAALTAAFAASGGYKIAQKVGGTK